MSAPLSEQQLAEIRGLDLLGLVGERNAGRVSAYFAVLLAEVDRLRTGYGDAVATVARLEQKRVELEKVANAERERVTELEAERHSTNEALDDAVAALRAKEQAGDYEVVAYRSPQSGSLYCVPCHAGDVYTPVTSDDLPDGGLCAACDVDVLITPAEAGEPR